MSDDESIAQITLRKIREEWEAPLRAHISELEIVNRELEEDRGKLRLQVRMLDHHVTQRGARILQLEAEHACSVHLTSLSEMVRSDGRRGQQCLQCREHIAKLEAQVRAHEGPRYTQTIGGSVTDEFVECYRLIAELKALLREACAIQRCLVNGSSVRNLGEHWAAIERLTPRD